MKTFVIIVCLTFVALIVACSLLLQKVKEYKEKYRFWKTNAKYYEKVINDLWFEKNSGKGQ